MSIEGLWGDTHTAKVVSVATHPDALRPTVGFVGYIDDNGNSEPIVACLRTQGLDVSLTSDGNYLTVYRVPCLESAGIPTDTPPTRQEFIDSWPGVQWYPSTYSGIADPADLAAVNKTCPPSPPGL